MVIYKFGGTSVGSPERMKKVAKLITVNTSPKIVVLSAVSGTTNKILEIADLVKKGNSDGAKGLLRQLVTFSFSSKE